MKKIVYILLAATLLFTGCGKKKAEEAKIEESKKVFSTAVVKRELTDKYEADAVAVPKEKVNYVAESGGTVIRVNKKNGDKVKKGDVILELTDSAVEASYSSAKAAYEAAKHSFNITKNNYGKYKVLYDKGNASQPEYDSALNAFNEAEGNLLSKKAQFEDAEDKFKKLKRVALTEGIVGNLYHKAGNKIEKGENLFTVIDESEMEATVDFPGKWFSKLNLGGEAIIIVPELENKELKGYIKEINPIADPDTKKYKVKVGIPNIEPSSSGVMVKDGMYLKAVIPAGKREVMVVPEKSVQVRSLLSYVYLIKDGAAKRIEVTPGTVNAPFVEIVSDNVHVGDKVIVDGIFGLNDGEKVEEIIIER